MKITTNVRAKGMLSIARQADQTNSKSLVELSGADLDQVGGGLPAVKAPVDDYPRPRCPRLTGIVVAYPV